MGDKRRAGAQGAFTGKYKGSGTDATAATASNASADWLRAKKAEHMIALVGAGEGMSAGVASDSLTITLE